MTQELTPAEKAEVARFAVHDEVRGVVILVRESDPMRHRGAEALAYITQDDIPTGNPVYFHGSEQMTAWEAAMGYANSGVDHYRKRVTA